MNIFRKYFYNCCTVFSNAAMCTNKVIFIFHLPNLIHLNNICLVLLTFVSILKAASRSLCTSLFITVNRIQNKLSLFSRII